MSYITHLEGRYTKKTFARKTDYIRYNFGKIVKSVKDRKNSSVLEIGPGKGEFVKYFLDNKIKDITIMDNDPTVIGNIRKQYRNVKTILSDGVSSLKNKSKKYDLIVMIQVLEHMPVENYFSILKTLYSKLNKNGYIIIVVPNAGNPLGIVERYGDIQHTSAFSEQSLKDLMVGSGLGNFSFEIFGFRIPPYNLVNIIRIVLQKILHLFLKITLIINGGTYFRIMEPNISLVIKKVA